MKLSIWTYEGPPHVGAMRVATAMEKLHFVLHAPQGDTYADLLFTMIERGNKRPPVTYTTFQARDLGADTADLFKKACKEAVERFKPEALLVGASCTAELIQDDPGGLADALNLEIPVIPLELPSYQRKENFGTDETFYQIVKALACPQEKTEKFSVNILGPTALGFRHRDDVRELKTILDDLNIDLNIVAPLGAAPSSIKSLTKAHANIMLYPESSELACRWLKENFGMPYTEHTPIGINSTKDFIQELNQIRGCEDSFSDTSRLNFDWWSKSVDSNYFTGKRVFIFGDATHVATASRIAKEEMAFSIVGIGCYNREYARKIRSLAKDLSVDALISDDYLEVERRIADLQPELILGSQMERHIGKRLGIPCAVISAPFHVQDHPARFSPQVGWEGANVIFDTWVHPLVMGLEEHLLGMFREDFEFNDTAGPSHLSNSKSKLNQEKDTKADNEIIWAPEATKELKKIPFFVRGKAKRNTEKFAFENGHSAITKDLLYEAKAHYAR